MGASPTCGELGIKPGNSGLRALMAHRRISVQLSTASRVLLLAFLIGGFAPNSSRAASITPPPPITPQTAVEVGYRDFSFGTNTLATPTGEKPQSKLWWNDGVWWGCLWDTAVHAHGIYRFDSAA